MPVKIAEMPRMIDVGHAHSTYAGCGNVGNDLAKPYFGMLSQGVQGSIAESMNLKQLYKPEAKMAEQKTKLRYVQIFIADTDERVPLIDRLLYKSEPKVTDATDQELFFEVDVRELLTAHNVKRVKIVDKSIKDRVEHLEPVRVRDLTVTVVTIASF